VSGRASNDIATAERVSDARVNAGLVAYDVHIPGQRNPYKSLQRVGNRSQAARTGSAKVLVRAIPDDSGLASRSFVSDWQSRGLEIVRTAAASNDLL
jgi:hypothetical protein